MVLVAGFFVFNIPAWIGWLKYLSFVYYCYSLLLKVSMALLIAKTLIIGNQLGCFFLWVLCAVRDCFIQL